VAIEAQRRTTALVEFLIDKARLLDRLRGQLNRDSTAPACCEKALKAFRGLEHWQVRHDYGWIPGDRDS
jgi:hypothetical protein